MNDIERAREWRKVRDAINQLAVNVGQPSDSTHEMRASLDRMFIDGRPYEPPSLMYPLHEGIQEAQDYYWFFRRAGYPERLCENVLRWCREASEILETPGPTSSRW